MDTLARRLSRSPRTIQRHLHLLKERGLIEFVERKRDWHGRFGAYVYCVLHIAAVASRKRVEQQPVRVKVVENTSHNTYSPLNYMGQVGWRNQKSRARDKE
jgi:DNA-binding transcriptional ArsR family regulator